MPQIIKQPSISVCSSLSHGAFWDVSSSPALEPRPGMTSWVPWWSGHVSRIGGSKFGEPTICGRMWSWSILILTSTQMLELHDNIYIYVHIWKFPLELFMERLVRSATLCMFFNPTEVEISKYGLKTSISYVWIVHWWFLPCVSMCHLDLFEIMHHPF
jgi:hypothetical protein